MILKSIKTPSYEKKGRVIAFVELFWSLMGEGEDASHRNPRYGKCLEITLMHALNDMTLEFLIPLFLILPFARGEQSSDGGVLEDDIVFFIINISPNFILLKQIT